MKQSLAERLESLPFPYGHVINNINWMTSNMVGDMMGDPMNVLLHIGPTDFCWDELERQCTLRFFGDRLFLKDLHDALCRASTPPGGGGGGGTPGGNQPIDRSPKELCDPEKFVDYGTYEDCYRGCTEILKNYGLTNFGSATAVFQLIDKDSNKSGSTLYQKAIDCIDRHLNSDRPIIVGIDYEPGSGNNDGITDHFVVITGRGYNSSTKLYYYTYMETGTNGAAGYNTSTNRLIYNSLTNDFYAPENNLHNRYDVTHVRPNNGDTTGTTSQIN